MFGSEKSLFVDEVDDLVVVETAVVS